MCQGKRSAADYAIEFKTLAATIKWNSSAFFTVARFLVEIYARDPPEHLDDIIELAIRLDAHMELRRRVRGNISWAQVDHSSSSPSSVAGLSGPEPMQIGRMHLSAEERQCRFTKGLCLYCGGQGHIAAACPVNLVLVSRQAGGTSISPLVGSRTNIPSMVLHNDSVIRCFALIDSGADSTWAHQQGFPIFDLPSPLTAHSLNRHELVTHITGPVSVITSGNHREELKFYLFNLSSVPIVLGHPWLSLHNLYINWADNTILSWSSRCHAVCLVSALSVSVSSVLQEEEADLFQVPAIYHDLRVVFRWP